MHSGAFSYTNSKVLFANKCRERYVIMVFLAIDSNTDRPIIIIIIIIIIKSERHDNIIV